MKKLLFVVILTIFSVSTVSAKAKRKEKKFHFAYEKTWFSTLSKKQKKKYFEVLNKLSMSLATNKSYVQVDPFNFFLDSLFPEAIASKLKLSNGHTYRGVNYQTFMNSLDLGTLTPTCKNGERPCALYTGLIEVGAGKYTVACADNETPVCVARGNRNTLLRVKGDCDAGRGEPSLCADIERNLVPSTEGLDTYCNETGWRKKQDFCLDAQRAKREAKIPDSPTSTPDAPTGPNCGKIKNHMVDLKMRNRPDGAYLHDNNRFWRDMNTVVQSVCGKSSPSKIMGSCDIQNMATHRMAPTKEEVTYNKSSNPADYNKCVADGVSDLEERFDKQIQIQTDSFDRKISSLSKTLNNPPSASVKKQLEDLRFEKQKKLREMSAAKAREIARFKSSNSSSCSETKTVRSTAGGSPLRFDSIDAKVLEKISKGENLLKDDEIMDRNRFVAATGLDPGQFRSVFCKSSSVPDMIASFRRKVKYQGKVHGISGTPTIDGLIAQSKAAFKQMKACVDKVAANDRNNVSPSCGWYTVSAASLKKDCVNPNTPLMLKNKEKGHCELISNIKVLEGRGEKRTSKRTGFSSRGDLFVLTYDRMNGERPKERDVLNIIDYGKGNVFSAYRCGHDSPSSCTYTEPRETLLEESAD